MDTPKETPSEINARQGDESRAAREAGQSKWIGVTAVVLAAVAVVAVAAGTASGPGPAYAPPQSGGAVTK